MINITNLLKSLDTKQFESLLESVKNKYQAIDDLKEYCKTVDIPEFKRKSLLEYADKNKDKYLAIDTYTEMQPVVATDDIKPKSVENGKVENNLDDLPIEDENEAKLVQHSATNNALKQQVDEQQFIAILEDSSIQYIDAETLESAVEILKEESMNPIIVFNQQYINDSMNLLEASLTHEQEQKKEEIVLAMKKNSRELKKRYGDKWESVMYAIATKKALEESNHEIESGLTSFHVPLPSKLAPPDDYKETIEFTSHDGSTIKITKDADGYFMLMKIHNGEVIDDQMYSSYKDAFMASKLL